MLLIWGTIQAIITGYEKKVLFVISQVANQDVEGLTYPGSDAESVAKLVIALWSRGFARALVRGFLLSLINWLISTFWKQHLEIIFLSSTFKIYSLKFFHFSVKPWKHKVGKLLPNSTSLTYDTILKQPLTSEPSHWNHVRNFITQLWRSSGGKEVANY